MEPIRSRQNERFRALIEAKKDKGLMLLEGRRLVHDALERGHVPASCALTPDYVERHGSPGFDFVMISEELFSKISETESPQGIAIFIKRPYKTIDELKKNERLIILDGLQDPGNVGTIIRTAEAFGFKGIIITPATASPFSDKAVRASMGSVLGIDIALAGTEEISRLSHRMYSLVLDGKRPVSSDMFTGRFAICLGSEGSGISQEMLGLDCEKVFIPMAGRTESLNVAVAAGIVMAVASGLME